MSRPSHLAVLLGNRHAAKDRPAGSLDLRTVRAHLPLTQHTFR